VTGGLGVQRVDRETWASILAHWPATLVVPGILIVVALLALITRLWDGRN
jgi:hypothetical protein